jgi:hypothetical protein
MLQAEGMSAPGRKIFLSSVSGAQHGTTSNNAGWKNATIRVAYGNFQFSIFQRFMEILSFTLSLKFPENIS